MGPRGKARTSIMGTQPGPTYTPDKDGFQAWAADHAAALDQRVAAIRRWAEDVLVAGGFPFADDRVLIRSDGTWRYADGRRDKREPTATEKQSYTIGHGVIVTDRDPFSPHYFANRALQALDELRHQVDKGNARDAARAAMTASEAQMFAVVRLMEPAALYGLGRKADGDGGGQKGNATKSERASAIKARAVRRYKELTATDVRDGPEAIEFMVREGWRLRTLQRHLKGLLRPRRRKPVKPRTK